MRAVDGSGQEPRLGQTLTTDQKGGEQGEYEKGDNNWMLALSSP